MSTIICAVLHVILSIFIPSANLLVIIVICRLKKRSSRNYVFILNLAAADLLVGLMCIGDALDDATDALFDTNLVFCLIRICMGITPCIGSILTLLLVSVDKYLAVKLPLHYPSLMSKKRVILSLVVLWVLSSLVGLMPLISSGLRQNKLKGNCGLLSAAKSDYLYIICFGIFTPALLILVCVHISVGRIAYRQHKHIQRSCLHADIPSTHLGYFKALKTTLIVIVCFIVFWGPYYGTAIVKATCKSCNLSPLLRDFLFLLGETNSLINPFVYSLYNKDIRTEFARLLKCKRKGQIKPFFQIIEQYVQSPLHENQISTILIKRGFPLIHNFGYLKIIKDGLTRYNLLYTSTSNSPYIQKEKETSEDEQELTAFLSKN